MPCKPFGRPSTARRGVTLIELNLALAIAAVVAILLFSLYATLSRSASGQQARRRGGAAIAQALAVIAQDLTLAMPIYGHPQGGFALSTEEGPRGPLSQVAFSVPRLDELPPTDPLDLRWFRAVAVEYHLEQRAGDRGRLVQLERPLIGPEALHAARTNVLAIGIDQFHIQVQVDDDWVDAAVCDPDDWENMNWPRLGRIRLVGDRHIRGQREHEVDVVIPAGWTFTPADAQ